MAGHLLVTNDFPPKVGGIQTYLWELWRRLPASRVTVLTSPHAGAEAFDRAQGYRIERVKAPVLLPTPGLARRVRALAAEVGAELVVLDPVLPLGHIAGRLGIPYAVVVHGAEISVPARLPGTRALLRRVLSGAIHVVAASRWVLAEVEDVVGHPVPSTVLSGVDVDRFRPLPAAERARVRARFGVEKQETLVVGMSRLVPRKGFDVLVAAAALAQPDVAGLRVMIAGAGRDHDRLLRLVAHTGAPVELLGRLGDSALEELMASCDIFAVPCRTRWGGLEQEGFGLVFLEAAACGVPQIAGDSGGAAEAVVHDRTGLVVANPGDPEAVARAVRRLADDSELRLRLGAEARRRAVEELSYDRLAGALSGVLAGLETSAR